MMKPRKTEITDKLRQEINKVQSYECVGNVDPTQCIFCCRNLRYGFLVKRFLAYFFGKFVKACWQITNGSERSTNKEFPRHWHTSDQINVSFKFHLIGLEYIDSVLPLQHKHSLWQSYRCDKCALSHFFYPYIIMLQINVVSCCISRLLLEIYWF